MANRIYNKQVSPKGYQKGGSVRDTRKTEQMIGASISSKREKGRAKKMGGGMMKRPMMKKGGSLKPVNPKTQKGLSKLPTEVRNKMGYMQDGGKVMKKASLNVGETLKQFKDLMTGSKDSKMSKQKEGLKKQIAEAKAQTRDRAKVKNKKG